MSWKVHFTVDMTTLLLFYPVKSDLAKTKPKYSLCKITTYRLSLLCVCSFNLALWIKDLTLCEYFEQVHFSGLTRRQLCLGKLVSWLDYQNSSKYTSYFFSKHMLASSEPKKMDFTESKIDFKRILGLYELIFF